MNYWTQMSIDYANQRNYLDDLFRVYPSLPEGIREIDPSRWEAVEQTYESRDSVEFLKSLLRLKLFPIKDPYVAYFRRDLSALSRNPATVARLAGRLYELGLNEIYSNCSQPKEMNRQIGPLFRRWLQRGELGAKLLDEETFLSTQCNAILVGSDTDLLEFAKCHLNYSGNKAPDFVGRFNNKYVIGEAKFLTDFGGHQNAQFADAIALLRETSVNAEKIAILDGILYKRGRSKMHRFLQTHPEEFNILSALVLREFLYQI
jgi:hypothetical protein